MKIRLVAYGIARDILKGQEQIIDLQASASIGDLKQMLLKQYPSFSTLASLRFAVGEEYCEDSFALQDEQEVIIIPPVSGG